MLTREYPPDVYGGIPNGAAVARRTVALYQALVEARER